MNMNAAGVVPVPRPVVQVDKIQEAEKRVDRKRNDPKAKYALACHYIDKKEPIPALALLQSTLKNKESASKVSTKKIKAKIKECSKKVEEQAKVISKVAKEVKFKGDITKLAKGKVPKKLKAIVKKQDTLLPVEVALIRLFTSAGQDYFSVLNAYLRNEMPFLELMIKLKKVGKEVTLSFLKESASVLKHCLKKMPSLEKLYPKPKEVEKRTVFRGMSMTLAQIQKLQKEMKFENEGFASNSQSMKVAVDFTPQKTTAVEPVLFVTEGRTGVPIHKLSKIESEKEVLFAPGTAFKISEIKKVTKDDAFAKQIHKFSSKFTHLWVVRMQEQSVN